MATLDRLGDTAFYAIIVAPVVVLYLVPAWAMYRLAGRVGYSSRERWGWAFAWIVGNWLALVVFAFSDWPNESVAAHRTSAST